MAKARERHPCSCSVKPRQSYDEIIALGNLDGGPIV